MMGFFRRKKNGVITVPPRRSWRHHFMAIVLLLMFVTGYNATTSTMQSCAAQTVGGSSCFTWPMNTCLGCIFPGFTLTTEGILHAALEQVEKAAASYLEKFLNLRMIKMVGNLLTGINSIETNTQKWTDSFWNYSLLPGMQAQTRQLDTALAAKTLATGSGIDAANLNETRLKLEERNLKNYNEKRPSENACVAGSGVGGFGRVTALSRALRDAMERESLAPGLNQVGMPGAKGAVEAERKRYEDYESIFCDPASNGGKNNCSGVPAYYNADTQPTKQIFNALTIDIVSDPLKAQTIQTVLNNMVGVPSMDPIPPGAIDSAEGAGQYLDRRSLLARYAAARSVPQLSVSWRTPGSQMGEWVKALSEKAGVSASQLPADPSYLSVKRAIVDRFNSGRFAVGMITDKKTIQQEKLMLSVFQLMMLRDYFKLLERKALTLAVQVAVMSDQEIVPDTMQSRPVAP